MEDKIMVDSKELADYLYNKISSLRWRSRGELFTKLTPETLEFWIKQQKIKSGHSEWSEKFQRNIWIVDKE